MSRKVLILTAASLLAAPAAFAQEETQRVDEETRAQIRAIVEDTKAQNDVIREDIAPLREEVRTIAADDFDAADAAIRPIVETARGEQRRLTEDERASVRTSLETLKTNVTAAAPEQVETIQALRGDVRANRQTAREDIRALLPEDVNAGRAARQVRANRTERQGRTFRAVRANRN